ncbi:Protein GZF3 [Nakaseomyces bracarensis]|uniref:Protein GZF3 n=1 Tax=Nakaseomyces bracarensis TaxID=273131 RepID=A0ABR4NM61_9SACH
MLVPNSRLKGTYLGMQPLRRGTFPVVSYNYTLGRININSQFQAPLQDELVPIGDLIPKQDHELPLPQLPPVHTQVVPQTETTGETTDTSTEIEDLSRRNSISDENQVCQNCSTSNTPLWRRDSEGTVLCNACGLFLKLHGRSRPISLKTDTIKHRNRKRKKLPRKKNGKTEEEIIKTTTTANMPMLSSSPTFAKIAPLPSTTQEYSITQPIRRSCSPADTLPDPRLEPRTLLDRDLQNEEFVIKLKTRVNELESLTKLYRGHILQLEKRCHMLETKLNAKNLPMN